MKWFLLLPAWFLFNVFVLCVNWAAPRFATMQNGPINNNNGEGVEPRLPKYLSWLMTEDNSLWGDGAFKESHDGGYWSQVAWLYRNPAYGFERSVLAARISPNDTIAVKGDIDVRDQPSGKEGFCYTKIGKYWNLVWVRKASWWELTVLGWEFFILGHWFEFWPFHVIALIAFIYSAGLIGNGRSLKFNFGWNLKTYAEDPSRLKTQPIAQFAMSPRTSAFKQ